MLIAALSVCTLVTFVMVLMLCSCFKRKRQNAIASNNTRRSLPDIPLEGVNRVDGGAWDPNNDNSSELYATVEPYNNLAKRHTLTNGLETPRPQNSNSQSDDPYASVNYDKFKEHPYAIVKAPINGAGADQEENLEEPTARTNLLPSSNDRPGTSHSESNAPPRSRRSSAHSSTGLDINAASAVSGGIAASQELPYMTPPIAQQQINFSGDSQDSSKGYTSISVREPLANIIAQTKEMNKVKRCLDPHYSTVSDDSDEMYTTIPDPNNQEYTSGSETYAQIQPLALTVAAEINHQVPSTSSAANSNSVPEATDESNESAPQPPSVDSLKSMTNSHSRQASSSSSVLNLGSPKPEKRQANSPLPPPPSATTSPDQPTAKNLDDMYAKVHKNRNKKPSTSEEPPAETVEVVNETKQRREHNYETLKKSPRKNSDPGYEKVKNGDCDAGEPNYASINGPDSLRTDPGYEEVCRNNPDPNYEQVKDHGYSTIKESMAMDGYSVVNKSPKEDSESDPNYESVSQNDPNYESVKYLDVGYEPLQNNNNTDDSSSSKSKSGYETVENNAHDPPYEKLNEDNKTDSESSGYEKIEKKSDYETLQSDDDEIFQV